MNPATQKSAIASRPTVKILVAEDEIGVFRLIESNLKRAGFVVSGVAQGDEVAKRVFSWKPTLLLLDIMLPGLSGFEICRILKSDARSKSMPIIMLTAKALERDRVHGFEIGADDYVTKPFSPRELVLRVQAQVRKIPGQLRSEESLAMGEIVIDRAEPSVRVGNRRLSLTVTEFKLLTLLMERAGRVQSRNQLLTDVWGYEGTIESRTVDIYITRLRSKLGRAGAHLETVRGFGYRFAEKPSG
ncbi:MAG: response regulator transcription factor [Chthoniobacterales bacterium]|nr:response regulator transcription factor [Chthoniobacterales bacterium]